MIRLAAFLLGVGLAAAAGQARAEQRLAHDSGAFAIVVNEDWAREPESAGIAVKCAAASCGGEVSRCEAKASKEFPGSTRDSFLAIPASDFDKAFRQSGGDGVDYEPTVAYERRRIGAKDAFYGEYDLKVEGAAAALKVLRLQSFNKARIVDLSCMADAAHVATIREIVKRFELP